MPDVSSPTSLWSGFTAKAELVGAAVMRIGSQESASSTLRVAGEGLHCTARVTERFPRASRSLSQRVARDEQTTAKEVVAVAEFAVAETGSVALHVPEVEVCRGFGGGASIDHPEVSRGIVARKLDNVRTTGASVLCSDNPGCILHMRGAADAAGFTIEVKHVAEVIAEALTR